jgi:hypothetical protein
MSRAARWKVLALAGQFHWPWRGAALAGPEGWRSRLGTGLDRTWVKSSKEARDYQEYCVRGRLTIMPGRTCLP